jgi:hypothetical protein
VPVTAKDPVSDLFTLFPNDVAIEVEKLASSPKDSANSLSVSSVDGAESTKLDTAMLIFVSICPEVKKEPVSDFGTNKPVAVLREPVAIFRAVISESFELTLVFKFPVAVSKEDKSEDVIKLDISFGLTTLPVTKLLKLPVIVTGSPVLTVTLAELTPADVTCIDSLPETVIDPVFN